ncbi:Cytokinesis protein [Nymphaea thermarum]|nr:Cytokinesis protein [Nymphaea thermarum]
MGREEWVKGRTVGRGAFGTVNLATCCKSSSSFDRHHPLPSLFAVKSAISSSSSLHNEAFILSQIPHSPRIIRCFGGEWMLGSSNHGAFNLFLEYVSGGSLSDFCRRSGKLDELTVRPYARGILEGLSHVHRHGFVHCDIKPSNVLLDPVSGVKIADFGLAKRVGERAPPQATIQGTPMYMSPEVAAGDQPVPASDVWSLGCTVIELVTGKPPWDVRGGGRSNVVQLLYRIGVSNESPKIPAGLSEQGKDFLGRCFEKDPRRRWTAEMLLHHEFVCSSGGAEVPSAATEEPELFTSPKGALDSLWWSSSSQSSSSPSSESSIPQTIGPRPADSPASRIQRVATCHEPDWLRSGCEKWVQVREAS